MHLRFVAHAIICLSKVNLLIHSIVLKHLHLDYEHTIQLQSEQMQG
jgi:hypothetical protein